MKYLLPPPKLAHIPLHTGTPPTMFRWVRMMVSPPLQIRKLRHDRGFVSDSTAGEWEDATQGLQVGWQGGWQHKL